MVDKIKEKTIKDGISIFLSLLGWPSLLAILGMVLFVYGISKSNLILIIVGILWIITDVIISLSNINEFITEINSRSSN